MTTAPQTAMSASSPMRVKRHRRWIIIAGLLVLSPACIWWYWPRGDARLVGTWDLVIDGSDGPPSHRVTLHRNGSLTTTRKTALSERSWRVENDMLMIGTPFPAWADRIAPHLEPAYERWTGDRIWGSVERWEILDLGKDEIVVQSRPDTTRVYVFRRAP